MYFEFTCAQCNKRLKIREEYANKKTRCPYCHYTQVPTAPPAPPDTGDPLSFLEQGTAAPREGAQREGVPREGVPREGVPREGGPREGGPREGGPSPAARQERKPAAGGSDDDSASGTEVSIWKTGLLGFAIFVAVYTVLYPFQNSYLGALLWRRGWVQFAEVFLAAWSGVILVFKTRKLTKQKESMLFDLLPNDISRDINAQNTGQFIRHIRGLPVQPGQSFLVNRVLRGLEHFGILGSSGEVSGRLASQSDIDSNAVDSSYSLIKVFVWAIPILGFIGTVQGIGQAVGAFSATMSAAGDMSALKDSFNLVTAGLATAFDTTLLALVLSMFIMFPMSSTQKSEQDLLNWVDEYCNENLLKRLKEHAGVDLPSGVDQKALQAAIEAAMVPHHAEFRAWGQKLEALGDNFSRQMAKTWSQTEEQIRTRHAQAMKEIVKATETFQESAERLKTASEKQASAMADLAKRTAEIQDKLAASIQHSAESIGGLAESVPRYLAALGQALSGLNEVLGQLGEKQVVVQAAPRRRGWFFFSRRDGS